MGAGYLKVQAFTGGGTVPLEGAEVFVFHTGGRVILRTETDKNGSTEAMRIPAPEARFTLDPDYRGQVYSAVNVLIRKSGFVTVRVKNVQIFDTVTSVLPQNLDPLADGNNGTADKYIIIPPHGLLTNGGRRQAAPPPAATQAAAGGGSPLCALTPPESVSIPEYITVRLYAVGAAAKTVKVRFLDFVKNAASGEIFPTWPQNAIEANITAISTFALNRIYTGWYSGSGYDITGSAVYDVRYCAGGHVFDSISKAADSLSGTYARRKGSDAPIFAKFANGASAPCDGLSQWGSLALAKQGKTPLEILRCYYARDLEIAGAGFAAAAEYAIIDQMGKTV